jgi:hypothetical protein
MSWFYEIRSSNNAVPKRIGGFATQDAAKIAGREDAKKIKNSRQPGEPDVERIMVGQNAEQATQYWLQNFIAQRGTRCKYARAADPRFCDVLCDVTLPC